MVKLTGLLLVALGFALRINPLPVIVVAGLTTGLLAGFTFREVLAMIGNFFVSNRGLILPIVLMVPVIGVLERHGLQQHVAALIRRSRATTAGGVLWLYQVLRGVASVFGLSLGNHASMVRPLIAPMGEGAAARDGGLAAQARADIRAQAAAAENVGNFFADDIVVAVGALLLIKAFFDNAGVEVSLRDIKLWSVPTALWVVGVGWWRCRRLDRRLRGAERAKREGGS